MPRYMYLLTLILGLALPAHLPILPDRQIVLFLIFSVSISFFCTIAFKKIRLFSINLLPIKALSIFLVGYCVSSLQLGFAIDRQIPTSIEGLDLSIDIDVIGLPVVRGLSVKGLGAKRQDVNNQSVKSRSTRFDAKVISAHYISRKYEHKKINADVGTDKNTLPNLDVLKDEIIRLSWRQNDMDPIIKAGQRWRLFVRLKRPRGLVNPGGFDYQMWLLQQGISATGYVRTQSHNVILEQRPVHFFDGLRGTLNQRLFSDNRGELISVMRALIIGDKSHISPSQWDVLIKTGTAHLMAISGLHIGLVATFAFVFVRKLLPLIAIINSHVVILRVAPALASIVASGVYAGVADFAIPTQRAWTIVVLVNVAYMTGKNPGVIRLILYAATCVLAINPFASLQNGFWLSFSAVLCLVFCFANRAPKIANIKALFIAQLIVFLGLAVLLTIRQLPMSYLSPVANLIAVPVVSFLVIPCLFVAALLIFIEPHSALFFLSISEYVLSKLWQMLQWMAQADALLWLTAPSLLFMVIALIATFFVLTPRTLGLWLPGISLICVFFWVENAQPYHRVTVLDVGQGLSLVAESDDATMVYDVGAKFSPSFDIGSRILAPFLRYSDVNELELVTISHGDNDHAGGLDGLLNNIAVKQLSANMDLTNREQVKEQLPCLSGQKWRVGQIQLNVLWPHADVLGGKSNNDSCVILLQLNDFSMLLTGDIERSVERRLLTSGNLPKDIDVLVAPHHGSNTSSSKKFIEHLSPKHVIFSTGYKNRYHHPATKVRERYRKINSHTWNTAKAGAIVIALDKNGNAEITSEREAHPRPWY